MRDKSLMDNNGPEHLKRSIKPMSSDLLRQRRNLIIFSLILCFLKFAQIEIENFSIVGIEFSSFKNPHSVFVALWIAWSYFAVRYYQYFVQEGLPSFKRVYFEILDKKSVRKIDSLVKKDFPRNQRRNVTYTTLKSWNWMFSGTVDNSYNGSVGDPTPFKLPIAKWKLTPEIINSFFYVALNRSAFTDYFLPIIVAVITLYYCFYGWSGSLVTSLKSLMTNLWLNA